jgi:hypothetical protein
VNSCEKSRLRFFFETEGHLLYLVLIKVLSGEKSGCNKPSGDCIQGFSHASDSLMKGGAGKNIRNKNHRGKFDWKCIY